MVEARLCCRGRLGLLDAALRSGRVLPARHLALLDPACRMGDADTRGRLSPRVESLSGVRCAVRGGPELSVLLSAVGAPRASPRGRVLRRARRRSFPAGSIGNVPAAAYS